jgi:hypothetical protein
LAPLRQTRPPPATRSNYPPNLPNSRSPAPNYPPNWPKLDPNMAKLRRNSPNPLKLYCQKAPQVVYDRAFVQL